MGSHAFDLFLWLNGDRPVEWVQFHLTSGGDDLVGGRLQRDPNGGGRLQFANGVAASATDSGRAFEVEVVCEQAVISSLGGDSEFLLREAGGVSHRMTRALKVSVLEYVTELTNQSTKPACLARRPPRPPPQPIGPVKPSIQRHRGRIRTSSDACDHRGQ